MAKSKKQQEVEEELEDGAEGEGEEAGEGTEGGAKPKSKYQTMVIGVSKARTENRQKLEELATKLGCKPTDLIWLGIEHIIANPPKVAPVGARTNVGTASGFWTVPILDNKNKAVAVKVTEVEARGEITNGRTFFRFKKGDDKERARAKAQALRAAQSDAQMIGFKGDITVEELSE